MQLLQNWAESVPVVAGLPVIFIIHKNSLVSSHKKFAAFFESEKL